MGYSDIAFTALLSLFGVGVVVLFVLLSMYVQCQSVCIYICMSLCVV